MNSLSESHDELTPAQKYWAMCRRDVYKQDSFPIFEKRGMSIHINTDEVEGKERVNYFKVSNSKIGGQLQRYAGSLFGNRSMFTKRIGMDAWIGL